MESTEIPDTSIPIGKNLNQIQYIQTIVIELLKMFDVNNETTDIDIVSVVVPVTACLCFILFLYLIIKMLTY